MKSVGEATLPATRPQVSTLETLSVGDAGETGRGVSVEPARPVVPARGVLADLVCAKLLQSCLTLCDPRNCIPPGLLSVKFSRQESWSGLPCPPRGIFPTHRSNPRLLRLPTLAGRFFPARATRGACCSLMSQLPAHSLYPRHPASGCSSGSQTHACPWAFAPAVTSVTRTPPPTTCVSRGPPGACPPTIGPTHHIQSFRPVCRRFKLKMETEQTAQHHQSLRENCHRERQTPNRHK